MVQQFCAHFLAFTGKPNDMVVWLSVRKRERKELRLRQVHLIGIRRQGNQQQEQVYESFHIFYYKQTPAGVSSWGLQVIKQYWTR